MTHNMTFVAEFSAGGGSFDASFDDFEFGDLSDMFQEDSTPELSLGLQNNESCGSSLSSPSHCDVAAVKKPVKKSNRNGGIGTKVSITKRRSSSSESLSELSSVMVSSRQQLPPRSKSELKLYAFPSFDKCDALLYFPNTMARYLNSGDFQSLTKLMNSHCDKSCGFVLPVYSKTPSCFTSTKFLELFTLMNELHPDSLMCCHSTKVVENEIQARMYFKFTDCQALYDAIARNVKDPVFAGMLSRERVEKFKQELQVVNKPIHEQQEIHDLLASGQDLVAYGQVDLGLKFDDYTKKITCLNFFAKFTSLIPASTPAYMQYKL